MSSQFTGPGCLAVRPFTKRLLSQLSNTGGKVDCSSRFIRHPRGQPPAGTSAKLTAGSVGTGDLDQPVIRVIARGGRDPASIGEGRYRPRQRPPGPFVLLIW